jgi:hypothetical protein
MLGKITNLKVINLGLDRNSLQISEDENEHVKIKI